MPRPPRAADSPVCRRCTSPQGSKGSCWPGLAAPPSPRAAGRAATPLQLPSSLGVALLWRDGASPLLTAAVLHSAPGAALGEGAAGGSRSHSSPSPCVATGPRPSSCQPPLGRSESAAPAASRSPAGDAAAPSEPDGEAAVAPAASASSGLPPPAGSSPSGSSSAGPMLLQAATLAARNKPGAGTWTQGPLYRGLGPGTAALSEVRRVLPAESARLKPRGLSSGKSWAALAGQGSCSPQPVHSCRCCCRCCVGAAACGDDGRCCVGDRGFCGDGCCGGAEGDCGCCGEGSSFSGHSLTGCCSSRAATGGGEACCCEPAAGAGGLCVCESRCAVAPLPWARWSLSARTDVGCWARPGTPPGDSAARPWPTTAGGMGLARRPMLALSAAGRSLAGLHGPGLCAAALLLRPGTQLAPGAERALAAPPVGQGCCGARDADAGRQACPGGRQ
jgi:hypothetical protein